MTRNDISKEWLIEHYENKKQSPKECANIIGCSQKTIIDKLRRYNIKVRTKSEGQKNRFKFVILNSKRKCILCGKEIIGRWYCIDCYKKGARNSESKRRNSRKAAKRNRLRNSKL